MKGGEWRVEGGGWRVKGEMRENAFTGLLTTKRSFLKAEEKGKFSQQRLPWGWEMACQEG